MDPAIRQGFAIGLVVAVAVGYFGWREGWWPTPGVKSAIEEQVGGKTESGVKSAQPPESARPPENAQGAAPQGAPRPAEPETQAARPSGPASAPGQPPAAGGGAPGDIAALAPPGAKPAGAPARASAEKGAFDVVRVEPSGEAVVAGRCAGRCVIELTVNGRTFDRATADDSGAWAMTPPRLPAGDHQLGLRVTTPDGKTATSEQSVTVSVPKTPKGEVAVVLNEPNAPSKILQRPGEAPAQAASAGAKTPGEKAGVSIGAVDAEKGRLFVQGTASAGATLRVYLNNALVAQPVAGREERWSVRIERGLTPGDYVARVDHVERPSGKVIARAEAKFAYEGEIADAAPNAAPKPDGESRSNPAAPAAQDAPSDASRPSVKIETPSASATAGTAARPNEPASGRSDDGVAPPPGDAAPAEAGGSPQRATDDANPVVASIDTTNVRRGDSLWRISRKTYGSGIRYTVIFTANDSQIRNPNLIYPGQVLVLPEDPDKAAARR